MERNYDLVRTIGLIGVLVCWPGHSNAGNELIDPSCLASFDIDASRGVAFQNQSMSCGDLEGVRVQLFSRIEQWHSDQGQLESDMRQLEAELDRAASEASESGVAAARDMVGGVVATIGVASCAGSGGTTCALAAIGYVISKWSAIDSSEEYSKKSEDLRILKKEVARARAELSQADRADALDEATRSFNELCLFIESECVR